MQKTKLSFYYLAGYLVTGGLAFLFVPQLSLQLFMSDGSYQSVIIRMVGLLLLALGILIVQMIRYQLTRLYGTTLLVRSLILICLLWFYFASGDPMMLVLFGIVFVGFVLTAISFVLDKRTGGSHDLQNGDLQGRR